MGIKEFVKIDLNNIRHCDAIIALLDEYMRDEMGKGEAMSENLAPKILNGIKSHLSYLGFLIRSEKKFVALANCNINYSTWQAKRIINIHDFIVHPDYRRQGIGVFLLTGIKKYAGKNDYCKLNLEVREDNIAAKKLYKKVGFNAGSNPMLFWELNL